MRAVGIAQKQPADRGGAGELDGLVARDVVVDSHVGSGPGGQASSDPVSRAVPLLGAAGGGQPGEAVRQHAGDGEVVLAEAGVVRVAGRRRIAVADAVHGNVMDPCGDGATERDRLRASSWCRPRWRFATARRLSRRVSPQGAGWDRVAWAWH